MDIEAARFVSTRTIKEKSTTINRLVAEKKDMVIITKRGKPTTVLISMDKLKELIGDEKFKELLYEFYTATAVEKDVKNITSGKEKTVPLEKLKKELGW